MQQAEGLFLFKYKQSGEEEEKQNYKNKPRQVKTNNSASVCRDSFLAQQSPNITFLREKPGKIFLFQDITVKDSIQGSCTMRKG